MNAPIIWNRVGQSGGFSTTDVGRLLRRSPSTVASWLKGTHPLIEGDYGPLHGRPVLSFEALVEARAISHFLSEGVEPKRLRQILADLRKTTGQRHPLAANRKLLTDGFRLLELTGEGNLVNLANEVYAHTVLMKPALIGRVVFQNGRASFFEPDPANAPNVRVDPLLSFGRPVVMDSRRAIPTAAVAATAEDEGVDQAADWFGISSGAAIEARDFERRLAA